MKIFDGHVHSPYCPHGSSASFESYIERALELKYSEITFTEHAPLPFNFEDPVPEKDSAMSYYQFEAYIHELQELKESYKNDLKINIGLEVDYIEGFEQETKGFLNKWGKYLDDAILSVHFLKYSNDRYICLDYSPDSFQNLITECSSLQEVYKLYYETVKNSITADLGIYKPKRIGHITLVRKFQKKFPASFDDRPFILEVLQEMNKHQLALDLNGAGLIKPLCKEFYPPLDWAVEAKKIGIQIVYGSDAHHPSALGVGIEKLKEQDLL